MGFSNVQQKLDNVFVFALGQNYSLPVFLEQQKRVAIYQKALGDAPIWVVRVGHKIASPTVR